MPRERERARASRKRSPSGWWCGVYIHARALIIENGCAHADARTRAIASSASFALFGDVCKRRKKSTRSVAVVTHLEFQG